MTPGFVVDRAPPTVEDVATNWDAINAETGYYVPKDLTDWSTHFMSHSTALKDPADRLR